MALRRVVRPLHCAHARVSAAASHHSTLCGMRAGCRTRCDVMSACRNALRATTEMRQVCARQLQGCVMPSARSQSHPGFPKGADTRSNRSHTISKRSPWDLAARRNAKFGSHLHCSDRGTGAVRPVVWQRGLSLYDKSIMMRTAAPVGAGLHVIHSHDQVHQPRFCHWSYQVSTARNPPDYEARELPLFQTGVA